MLLLKYLLFVALLIAIYPACTNFQLGQVNQRFYDNMNANLTGPTGMSPANPNFFSFSAMGDPHIGSNSGNLLVKALQSSQGDGDSFAVIAGDDSNTGLQSELTTFKSQVASVGLPIYPAIGNHDIFFGGWNNYKSTIGKSIYSVDAGSVHLTFLDTANGTFGVQQLNWLRGDLAATTKTIKIVVMHFPILMGQISSLYKLASDEEAAQFRSIMHQYGVQLVISGHYHGYEDNSTGGTRYLVTGACNDLLDIGNSSGYVKVMINNGAITTRFVPL